MSKSVVWSSVVFTMFVGSGAYVGVSAAMAPPAPLEPEFANTSTVVAAKPKLKARPAAHMMHGAAQETAKSVSLNERPS